MHLLIYLRRKYTSPLPPTALLRRLEHTVLPRPAGLLWWLGIRYLPCWGKVEPATNAFWARTRWGRSGVAVIRGSWQVAPTTLPLAGTVVRLIIRPKLSELLIITGFLVVAASAGIQSSPTDVLIPLLLLGVAAFFWAGMFWLDIRRAERHFQQALLLRKDAG